MTFTERYAKEAIRWANIPVPYMHRGLTKRGCDCTGLLIGVARSLNRLKKYELRKYKFDWNVHSGACDIITTELEKVADCVIKSPPRIGDLLVFRFGKCNAHAGIFVGDYTFAHSLSHHTCQLALIKNSQWSARWTSTYRFNDEKMAQFA